MIIRNKKNTYIFVLLTLIVVSVFLWIKGIDLLDSDMSSEMVLGKLLSNEKSILSENWYYSSQVRITSTNLIFPLFHSLFDNWHVVRTISTIVLLITMAIVIILTLNYIEIEQYSSIICCLLLLPISSVYYYIVVYGAFYITSVIHSFLAFYLFRKYSKEKKMYLIGVSAFLAFVAGLNGPRQIALFYLPYILSSLFLCSYDYYKNTKKGILGCFKRSGMLNEIISVVFSLIGYEINIHILSKKYSFLLWNNLSISFSFSRIKTVLLGVLKIFGYDSTYFSKIVAIVFVLATFVSILYSIIKINKVSENYIKLSMFYIFGVIVFVGIYVFTNMSYSETYFTPIFVFSLPLLFFFVKENRNKKRIMMLTVAAFVFINCLFGLYQKFNENKTEEFQKMAKVLNDNNYKVGYSTFWNGNIITELSNGNIEMVNMAIESDSISNVYNIQQIRRWLQPTSQECYFPLGKVFILLTNYEKSICNWQNYLKENKIIYSSDEYTIYGYETYNDLLNDFTYYKWKFDGSNSSNCCDANGIRTIYPSGITYGPYIYLYNGSYIVSVKGQNIDKCSFVVSKDYGESGIDYKINAINSVEAEIGIDIEYLSEGVEIKIANDTDENIYIEEMQIERNKIDYE